MVLGVKLLDTDDVMLCKGNLACTNGNLSPRNWNLLDDD